VISLTSAKKETKRERFVRLANKRTNEVLDKLRILGGCANRRMYEYTESDVKNIFKSIDDEHKRIRGLFTEDKRTEFRLEV
jgi:hypothetical protein